VDWYRISYHQRNGIHGVMVSMLASNPVDRGFIGGVMASMLASNPVDHGFIGGVMVSMLASIPIHIPASSTNICITKKYFLL
jgi:hypothetical protein